MGTKMILLQYLMKFWNILLSFFIGCLMIFLAFKHNSQGEIINYETGDIDYLYLFLIFSSWFIVIFILTVIFKVLLQYFIKLIRDFK